MQLYKVLTADGLPAHGGIGVYPMPKRASAGAWTEPIAPRACERGYHLTSRPASWWVPGARLFVAEYRGAVDFSPPDKIACESVRLVAEVTGDWSLLPLYPEFRALLASSWRFNNPDAENVPAFADLSGADLFRADLSGANLSGAYLSGAYLSGADLFGAYGDYKLPTGWKVNAVGVAVKS
jgi:hypothetical protein